MPWANFFVLGVVASELSRGRISLPAVVSLGIAIRLTYVSYDWTFIPLSNAGYLTMSLIFMLAVLASAMTPKDFQMKGSWKHALRGCPVSLQEAKALGLHLAGLVTALLSLRPVVFLGNISYALYLIHQAIGFIIIKRLEQAEMSGTAAVLLTGVAMVALAALITYRIEVPLRKAIARRHVLRPNTPAPTA